MTSRQFVSEGDEPLVSVVIPTYNRDRLLQESIASVLSQRYAAIQLIVVDDCSTEPPHVPDDPRILLVRTDRNGGPSAAKNAGAALAQGVFLTFLDDDDVMTANRVASAVALAGPGLVSICRLEMRGPSLEGGGDKPFTRVFEGDMSASFMADRWPSVGQALIHRSDFLPFDDRLRTSEDREWWIRMCQCVRFANDPSTGLLVRRHSEVRVGVGDVTRLESRLLIMRWHHEYFRLHRHARALGWQSVAQAALVAGRRRVAIGYAIRSLLSHPSRARVRVLARSVFPWAGA